MANKISISAKVLKKLRTHETSEKEPFCGLLYGLCSGGESMICSHYSFEESAPKSFLSQFDEAAKYVVEGVEALGFFVQSGQAFVHSCMLNMCLKYFASAPQQQACFHGNEIIIMAILAPKKEDGDEKKCFFYRFNAKSQELASIEVEEATPEVVKEMKNKFTLFHIEAKLPVTIHHSNDLDEKRLSIQHSINQLANQLSQPLTLFKLPTKQQPPPQQQQHKKETKQQGKQQKENKKQQQLIQQSKYLLIRNTYIHTDDDPDYDDDVNDDDEKNDLEITFDKSNGGDDSSSGSSSKGGGVRMEDIADVIHFETINVDGYEQRVVQVELLMQCSGTEAKPYYLTSAPLLYHDHLDLVVVSLDVTLDVAVLVAHGDSGGISLSSTFTRAIHRQLVCISETLNSFSRSSVYYIPRAYHYSLLDSLITLLYPEGVQEAQLKETRKALHKRFLIPLSSPFFKRSKHTSLSTHCTNPHLTNVHIGLPPSKVKGKVTLVQGSYEYRHYMQDKCNDDGWGCAYRSLQTIASWLYMQAFTEKSVPTHLQIQQALVEVADKLPSFLGSKKWIGSNEVAYVLDHLYSVQCRICHVSSGSEMPSKVREIVHHFETQGSPIMIGGGVLAHTIIGVDFNEVTGEVAYLILDPHYTGSEDLKTIQEKGWCGWKGGDFWEKNSFYNMCMPLKPTVY